MKLSQAALYSIALATVSQGLVLPSIEDFLTDLVKEFAHEAAKNVVVLAPKKSSPVSSDNAAPLHIAETHALIPHRYMVVLKDNVSSDEMEFHRQWVDAEQANAAARLFESEPHHDFFAALQSSALGSPVGGVLDLFNIEGALAGYSGYFLDSTIELLRKNPLVKYVEQDSVVYALEVSTQNGAPWGLARVSHRESLNLGSFNKYLYDGNGGEGVIAYVIDTGVLDTHEEFEGRAKLIADIPNDGALDGNGHGTHCAGTMISKTYGVAKKAHLRGVKVLGANGSGTMSDVVKGVEVATKDYIQESKKGKKGFKGASGNMSLGGGKSPTLDLAVNAAVKNGIVMLVAAGNENQDACNTSPARAELAITVGASTIADSRAYFSNWGKCLDVFAPGLNVLSTYIGSNTATATLSGTSMASPHVAGLSAYFLSLVPESSSGFSAETAVTPAQIKKNLISFGTSGVLSDVGEGSPNVLIYNGAGGDLSGFWTGSSSAEEKDVIKPVDASLLAELDSKIEEFFDKLL